MVVLAWNIQFKLEAFCYQEFILEFVLGDGSFHDGSVRGIFVSNFYLTLPCFMHISYISSINVTKSVDDRILLNYSCFLKTRCVVSNDCFWFMFDLQNVFVFQCPSYNVSKIAISPLNPVWNTPRSFNGQLMLIFCLSYIIAGQIIIINP